MTEEDIIPVLLKREPIEEKEKEEETTDTTEQLRLLVPVAKLALKNLKSFIAETEEKDRRNLLAAVLLNQLATSQPENMRKVMQVAANTEISKILSAIKKEKEKKAEEEAKEEGEKEKSAKKTAKKEYKTFY